MGTSLKKETAKGVAWSGIDKIVNVVVQLLANIILARLLVPKDFGLIALIAIFIQIAQAFIDSGFSNALIQKKDCNQTDFSTVYFFNLAISILFYAIIFVSAPFIARFFDNEQLTVLTRVVGLNLIIGSLAAVHKTRLTIQLRFKVQSIISLISSGTGASVAIWLAYNGYGVWSLVFLNQINIALQTILIYAFIKWSPSLVFSRESFKQLFSYSSKLLGASLLHILYRNIYPVVIGKKFSATELGYFNRADKFAEYPSGTLGSVISRVAFPIFSRIQNDNERLRTAYSKYIIFASLAIFPLMTGLMCLAEPLTVYVLKPKWLPLVPMLQILCIDWMTDHICSINLNVLYVKGRSDLALKLEFVKKGIALAILFISLYWGMIGVCVGRATYGIIAIFLNSAYTQKLIGLSIWHQLKDVAGPLMMAVAMSAATTFAISFLDDPLTKIVAGTCFGAVFYMVEMLIFQKGVISEIKSILRK